MIGVDVHIGSQLTDLAPFEAAFRKVRDLTLALRADGHDIRRLDLGGGLGIPYTRSNLAPPLPVEYGTMIKEVLGDLGCEIEIEPGRLISGNAGLMVSSVIYLKEGEGRNFLILDAAMNDLVRPLDVWRASRHHPGDRARARHRARAVRHRGPGLRDRRHLRQGARSDAGRPPAIWSPSARRGHMAR